MVVFVLGVGLVLLAIGLLTVTFAGGERSTGVNRSLAVLEAMSSAPKELTGELDRPFGDRVLAPLQQRAVRVGRRLFGADSSERLRRKLDLAGNPRDWSADRVVSVKVIGAVTLLAAGFALSLAAGASFVMVVACTAAGSVVGFLIPDLYLYQAKYNRSLQMQKTLPDAIDLLTISVESGLGFDAACQQVARNTEGPLAEEFARMLRETQLGSSRSDALRSLAERTDVDDVRSFVGAMVQADAFGIPIGQVLRVQSSEMRVKRRQYAEMKAQQVPVKMTVPLIFNILPCLFVAVMGPAVIQMIDNFSK